MCVHAYCFRCAEVAAACRAEAAAWRAEMEDALRRELAVSWKAVNY